MATVHANSALHAAADGEPSGPTGPELDRLLRDGKISPAEWDYLKREEIREALVRKYGPGYLKGAPPLPPRPGT